ncbi:hypothetical protein ACWC4E_24155 [Streptomyces sp. NPDC001273]|uniref:hypothetical protein n=1 Tax=unclassified Streptomyces TaxID=2593676 RepID=UPI003407365F
MSRIDNPAEVDAAFERGEWPLGSAVIGLAFNCSLEEASPRIAERCSRARNCWPAAASISVRAPSGAQPVKASCSESTSSKPSGAIEPAVV